MILRFLLTIFLIFSGLYLPIWITFGTLVLCFFVLPSFIEGILIFLAMDFVYGTEHTPFGIPLIHFAIALVLYFGIKYGKTKLFVRQ